MNHKTKFQVVASCTPFGFWNAHLHFRMHPLFWLSKKPMQKVKKIFRKRYRKQFGMLEAKAQISLVSPTPRLNIKRPTTHSRKRISLNTLACLLSKPPFF